MDVAHCNSCFLFFPIIYGNVCIHKLALSYTISKLPSCIDNVPYNHIKERVYMKQHVRSYTKSGHLNNSSYIDIASLKANKSSFNYLLHVNHRKLSKHSNHIQWYFMLLHISPMWYTCKIVEITFFLLLQSQMFICTWNEIIHEVQCACATSLKIHALWMDRWNKTDHT